MLIILFRCIQAFALPKIIMFKFSLTFPYVEFIFSTIDCAGFWSRLKLSFVKWIIVVLNSYLSILVFANK
jgi:hypothetical protein